MRSVGIVKHLLTMQALRCMIGDEQRQFAETCRKVTGSTKLVAEDG